MKEYLFPVEALIPYEQRDRITCGEASLVMVYRAFGERIDESQLVSEIQPEQGESTEWGGTRTEQMEKNALLHGYNIIHSHHTPYRSLIEHTQTDELPVIVDWFSDRSGETGSHYSVVVFADNELIMLADPEWGDFYTLPKSEFERKWSGYSLVVFENET